MGHQEGLNPKWIGSALEKTETKSRQEKGIPNKRKVVREHTSKVMVWEHKWEACGWAEVRGGNAHWNTKNEPSSVATSTGRVSGHLPTASL